MDTKRCSRCATDKPTSEFYKSKGWKDGYHPYCKKCLLAHQKQKRDEKRDETGKVPGTKYRWKRDLVVHDYFAEVDTPTKAYVLGFLAADGNVLPKHHRITIEISSKDAPLLSLLRDELVPGGAITTRKAHAPKQLNGHVVQQQSPTQTLAFVSRQMIEDLRRLGITAAKTHTLRWPSVLPDGFSRDFLLGYFDGDGYVTVSRHSGQAYPRVGFTSGSEGFLIDVGKAIERHLGMKLCSPYGKGASCFVLNANNKKARILDQWLHESGLGLPRKRLDSLHHLREHLKVDRVE